MTSRKALIIGAPDSKIPGVKKDVINLKQYLLTPFGGYWQQHEIQTLECPSAREVRNQLELLKSVDYSFVFFAGHGYHSNDRNRTILHVNSTETMDSLELRVGADKHTLVLDCCRKREDDHRFAKAAMESTTLDSAYTKQPNPQECRRYFDQQIATCSTGLVVMNACSINQTAGESDVDGGYYTSSLIDGANEWAKKTLVGIDLSKNFITLSTQGAHEKAVVGVRLLSGGRQTPTFDSPRLEKTFPFTVVA